MIKSFRGKDAEQVFKRLFVKKLSAELQRLAYRKLLLIDSVDTVEELKVPPGNRLEKLSGDRKGQHSVRINDQFRICFRWRNGDAYDVEIMDYH